MKSTDTHDLLHDHRRLVLVVAIAWWFGWSSSAWAEVPPAPGSTSTPRASEVVVDVEVAPGLPDAEQLARWIEEDAHEVLGRLSPESPRRGVLRITVTGSLYDYQVKLSALPDGQEVDALETWTCECSYEELRASCRTKVPAVAGALEVKARPEEPEAEDPQPEPPTVAVDDAGPERRKPLGLVGGVGVALMTVGAVGIVTGIPLIVLDERPKPPSGMSWGRIPTKRYRPPGIVSTGVGAGLLVAGVIVHTLRERLGRRRAQAAVPLPALDASGNLGLCIQGRF